MQHLISNLSLHSKSDYEALLSMLIEPTIPYFSEHNARISFPSYNATGYDDSILEVESFSRLLWGVAPWSNHREEKIFRQGIINGTNPHHVEYWGKLKDYDQRAVEMPSIALYIFFSKESFWDNLNSDVRKNICEWFVQINRIKLVDNNWVLFKLLVNEVMKNVGGDYDQVEIDNSLQRVEKFYLGDGWYSDGDTLQRDYYVSFAFHYYLLIFSKITTDKSLSQLHKSRAEEFSKEFIYWFSDDGSSLPIGRSLIYRFAHVSFWSACVFAEVNTFSLSIIKGIINRNLRWWFKKPILDENGILSIGYTYSNTNLTEDYNGAGSPYWALKSLMVLALHENHEFWKAEEEELPKLRQKMYQKNPMMTIVRNANHIAGFVNGQSCPGLINSTSKYEKYVYSNLFGFSVSKTNEGLQQGAFDSTIAISIDKKYFVPRNDSIFVENDEKIMYSLWKPYDNIQLETYIIPGLPWHVRVQKIQTDRDIVVQEGGFSTERKSHVYPPTYPTINEKNNSVGISYNFTHSAVVSLVGNGLPQVLYPTPNTNILFPRTELPVLVWNLKAGSYILVSAFLGDVSNERTVHNFWDDVPNCKINNQKIKISMGNEDFEFDLENSYKIPSSRQLKIKKIEKNVRETLKAIRRL